MRNPFKEKTIGARKFGDRLFYYVGRTIYPSKAWQIQDELKSKGIDTKVTKSKGAGSLLWASKAVFVDMSEPIWNPGESWHRDRADELRKQRRRYFMKNDSYSNAMYDSLDSKVFEDEYAADASHHMGMPNPNKRRGHQSSYTRFAKINLKHYINSGMHPTQAMKEMARDWQEWKGDIPESRIDRKNPTGKTNWVLPLLAAGGLIWWLSTRNK